MILISPPAQSLLMELAELGIELEAQGNAIRFRPMHAMTPALMQRLQANKAELLAFLDTSFAIGKLRGLVEALWKDPAWHRSWEYRFREAKYANFEALHCVLGIVLGLAEQHHQRRDWKAFESTRKYLLHLASGEDWDCGKPSNNPKTTTH